MTQDTKPAAFDELMKIRGLGKPADSEVSITGSEPFFRSPFRISETVASVLAATGVAANDLWEMRTGRRQKLDVSLREAGATLHVPEYTLRREADGSFQPAPRSPSMEHMRTITQPWPTADGRYYLPHFNLPHLHRRVLGVLKAEDNAASVSAAVKTWNSDELEQAVADARACGGKVRTREEWAAHPQGIYLAGLPVVEITKIGDSAPEPMPAGGDRPLSGIRVLDLTRILAGPTAGRTLGEHGADVLMVAAPDLPQVPEYVRDLSHGKRSSFLDLRQAGDVAKLKALAADADIFLSGYRPGTLASRGFGVEELTKARPGLISVSVSCFGSGGPFADRAGWEQVAQCVTGVCLEHGMAVGAGQPKLAPAPMCDYLTGYLAAYGALIALARRAREGGSYHVSASLCQSAMFYQRQGMMTGFENAPERLTKEELDRRYVRETSSYGELLTLGPALQMSETPCHWALPTPVFGGDKPEWVQRHAKAA